jgi:hypothetical protein
MMEDKDVLPFLNSLSPEQAKFADLVVTEAERQGVPPRFALALAWQESKLKPDAMGEKDEVGIMQVRPGTAQMYGYDPKELADPTRNIRIGVDILRRHLDSFNNDPMLAAIAYNAGPNLTYLTDPQKGQLPESTEAYVRDIYTLGGFTDMPKDQDQKDETAKSEQNLMQEFLSKFQEPEAKAQALTDLMAAGAGATVSKLADVGKEGMSAARDVRAILAAQAAAARAGPGTPPAPIPTDPMHTRQMQGTTDAGATGRARQTTYQTGTSQQASAAKQQADVIEQLKRQGVVSGDARSVMAKAPGLTATPSGVLLPSSQVYADIPPPQGTTPPPKPSLMQRTGQTTRNIAAGLGRGVTAPFRSPIMAGAMGGMGAMESGMEAQRRVQAGDMPGAGIAAAGTVGGLAMLAPNPLLRGVGAATAVSSPVAMYLYDKAKKAQEEGAGLKPPSIYAPMYLR